MRIFAGVPLRRGIRRQRGNRKLNFQEVVYVLSVDTEINDLGWPWTAILHSASKCMRFRNPPRKFQWKYCRFSAKKSDLTPISAYSTRIFGVFPLNKIAYVVAPKREDTKLIIRVISFELTPRYINVTDGQTDGRTDGRHNDTAAIPRVRIPVLFFPVCGGLKYRIRNYVSLRGNVRTLQCSFPIDNDLSRNCAEILMFLGRQISGRARITHISEWPNFINLGYHVAKFGDDRPSDLGE